jgi:hypothetical protein
VAPATVQGVLARADRLPDAERQLAAAHRDRKLHGGQGGAYMGRHVVRTFVAMPVQRVTIGDEPGHEALEVAEYLRIGIFLDQQAGGSVTQEEGDQSVGDVRVRSGFGDTCRDVVKSAAVRVEQERLDDLSLHLVIV